MRIEFLLCLLLAELGTAGCITGGEALFAPANVSEPTHVANAPDSLGLVAGAEAIDVNQRQ